MYQTKHAGAYTPAQASRRGDGLHTRRLYQMLEKQKSTKPVRPANIPDWLWETIVKYGCTKCGLVCEGGVCPKCGFVNNSHYGVDEQNMPVR